MKRPEHWAHRNTISLDDITYHRLKKYGQEQAEFGMSYNELIAYMLDKLEIKK